MSSNPEAAKQSHQLPAGGKAPADGSTSTRAQQVIDTGAPSVGSLDPSGQGTGSHADLTRNLKNQPQMKPVDATTPVPPGYPGSGGGPSSGTQPGGE